MIIEKLYKYKGPELEFFKTGDVYMCSDLKDGEYYFENYKGEKQAFANNPNDYFIASGMQLVNWRNQDNKPIKRNVESPLFNKLQYLGILDSEIRSHNVGASDYSKHIIQPWSIWLDYDLDPWDADIVKRILRTKSEPGKSMKESRILDYEKIIHICSEKIRQLKHDS